MTFTFENFSWSSIVKTTETRIWSDVFAPEFWLAFGRNHSHPVSMFDRPISGWLLVYPVTFFGTSDHSGPNGLYHASIWVARQSLAFRYMCFWFYCITQKGLNIWTEQGKDCVENNDAPCNIVMYEAAHPLNLLEQNGEKTQIAKCNDLF